MTVDNGRKSIAALAASLSLYSSHIDAAHRYFKLAVEHRFIQGRKTEYVVAACMYITCRFERTPHMLLDFADVLRVNVFTLGAVYLKLIRRLNIRGLPIIDPSLYILRFVNKMDFGDKTHEVGKTALRLVSRMKRDWMQVGRRPSGICGAGLLVAARLHGFSRTQKEVLQIVRVCDSTLRKRLSEFEDTPSSALTTQEFMTIDLEGEADPPSFILARKQGKSRARGDDSAAPAAPIGASPLEITAAADAEMLAQVANPMFRSLDDSDAPAAPAAPAPAPAAGAGAQAAAAADEDGAVPPPPTTDPTESDGAGGRAGAAGGVLSTAPAPASAVPPIAAATPWIAPEDDGALSDLSDSELDAFILKDVEVQVKSKMWHEVNKEYLEKQEAKAKQAALDKELGITKPVPKKRKRKRDHLANPAASADEAVKQMLAQKKVSKKINYAKLVELGIIDEIPKDDNPDEEDGEAAADA